MPDQTPKRKTRAEILGNARALRTECQAILDDCAHWNRLHPGETPIDIDTDGRLARIIAAVDELLANDPGHGPIAPLRGVWDGDSKEIH